jgi:ubiquinone/menaquinone biosynthesis C-methylase UbiE
MDVHKNPQNIEKNSDNYLNEQFLDLLTTTWKGLTITSGLIAGLFNMLTEHTEVTIDEIAKHFGYDKNKLDLWFYFAEKEKIVEKKEQYYSLSSLGRYFTSLAPLKDLYAFANLTEYYMEAALKAKETFKKGKSIDALSEGKISRNYQPKVSDNFSLMLLSYFKECNVGAGDSLLDIGCGNGSFLRILAQAIPDLQLTGLDSNLFAIEKGKKEDKQLELSNRIKLLVGNAEEDLHEFTDESYDWVTAINVLHFYNITQRPYLIDNMVRIAKKGIFFNEGILESSPITSRANGLMPLLWNDFSGFFRPDQLKIFNENIQAKFSKYQIQFIPVIHGTSTLVVITKQL